MQVVSQYWDKLDQSCAPDGGDLVATWTAPATGRYRIDTLGSEGDTVLSVWSACDGVELVCVDDPTPDETAAMLLVDATEGETLTLVAAPRDIAARARVGLSVERAEEDCTDGLDGPDADGVVDCDDRDCLADPACG